MEAPSLDPRVNRFNLDENIVPVAKPELDQFETYEVFFQMKEGKPYEHAGIVHAPNEEMAFLFAKEQFSRRYTCTGMWIVKTTNVHISELTEGEDSAYNHIKDIDTESAVDLTRFEVIHLKKRGKQQVHVGSVMASSIEHAFSEAKKIFGAEKTLNVWVIRSSEMLFSDQEDKDIWSTLPEKKYRDAIAYKSAEKINEFKSRNK